MEQSGFEPVGSNFDSTGKLKTMIPDHTPQQQSYSNTVQRITLDMPLCFQSESELGKQKTRQLDQFDRLCHCISKHSMLQNHANFKRSAPPVRLMYRTGGSWMDFPGDVVKHAKFAFLEQKAVVDIEVDGNDYLFDFYRMLQVHIVNGIQRSIAWIDVNGICFFPKIFVDDDGFDNHFAEVPKIEIEIKLENDVSAEKREREDQLESEEGDTGSSSSKGSYGKLKRPRISGANLENWRWPNARWIGEGEKAFSAIRDLFMAGMKTIDPDVKIISIHQFTQTGPLEKARWEVFYKQMEIMKAARGVSNCVFAWHGTSKKNVSNVLARGFGLPSKVSGSQACGVGVYLSPAHLPHASHLFSEVDENGERHVVLCRVILGNVEKVEAGSQQSHPSGMDFDNGVDEIGTPKLYVIWSMNMNTHILPECVVSYKCSDRLQGHSRAADSIKWIPNSSSSVVVKLFSKLGSMLPSSKVEELKSLCRSYKGGKMAKNLFIKQLRLVAGDETLLSAICAVQGLSEVPSS